MDTNKDHDLMLTSLHRLRLVVRVTLVGWLLTSARASREMLLSRPADTLLLDQHNMFRQEEKASDIFKMHWNASLEKEARRWANGCQFKHEMAGPWGENLYYATDSSGPDEKEVMLNGLELWHDEKRGWRYSSSACGAACHYTQMVWSKTTSLGCATKMCPGLKVGSRTVEDAMYLVCFYYPRGNWVGEYPFKMGRPCSECPGECQDGLCVEENSVSTFHSNEVQSAVSLKWSSSTGRHGNRVHHQRHHYSSSSSSSRSSSSSSYSRGSIDRTSAFNSVQPRPQELRRDKDPRQAQRVTNRLQRQRQGRQSRQRSPLDVLRAGSHWCRDRLPSCRIWSSRCLKSKAIYMSCPRTCGHCGRKPGEEGPNSLRDRPRPQADPTVTPTPRRTQRRQQRPHQRRRRPQRHPRRRHRQRLQALRAPKEALREGSRHRPDTDRNRAMKDQSDQADRNDRKGNNRTGTRPEASRRHQPRRQRQRGKQRGQGGHGRRRRVKVVDRRAEKLAEFLRHKAISRGSCADDPKYVTSCPFWVSRGFCTGNELVSNVFCKKSCGAC